MDQLESELHEARKSLFALGVSRGYVTLPEVEAACPEGSLTPSERWLLFYCLSASGIEIQLEKPQVAVSESA